MNNSKAVLWANIIFYGTITIGLFLPVLTEAGVTIIFSDVRIGNVLKSGITSFTDHIFTWVLNAIPFILAAILMRYRLLRKEKDSLTYTLKISQAVGAWITILIIGIWLNLEIHISPFLQSPGYSTGVIAYSFFPIYGIFILLLGYILGWIAGGIIVYFKGRK